MQHDISFHLANNTNTTVEGVLEVVSARLTERLSGESVLTLEVLEEYNNALKMLPEDYADGYNVLELQINKYIQMRFYKYSGGASTEYNFRISNIETDHQNDGSIVHTVTCEHIKYSGADQVIPIARSYAGISSQELLTECMAHISGFSVSTNDLPSTRYRNIDIQYPTLIDLLNMICKEYQDGSTKIFFSINHDRQISIRYESSIGSDTSVGLIYDKNMSSIRRTIDRQSLVNRLYAKNADGTCRLDHRNTVKVYDAKSPATLLYSGNISETRNLDAGSGNTDNVVNDSILSIRIALLAQWSAPSGYVNFDFELELLDSGGNTVWGANRFTSDDVIAPSISATQWINIPVADADNVKQVKLTWISTNLYGGGSLFVDGIALNYIWYELGSNLKYIESSSSQSKYGLVEAAKTLDWPSVNNLFRDYVYITSGAASRSLSSTFSGTYNLVGGGYIHEGWTQIASGGSGGIKNSNRDYIRNGIYSQRFIAVNEGDGLVTNWGVAGLVADEPYYAFFELYMLRGSVKIRIYDDDGNDLLLHTTSGHGWTQVLSETPIGVTSKNSHVNISILAEGGRAEWYLDAVQVARGYDIMPFIEANSADDLHKEASRILNNNDTPRTIYNIDMTTYPKSGWIKRPVHEEFGVGDTVLVYDSKTMVAERMRVYSKESDLLGGQVTNLQLADKSVPLASMISLFTVQKDIGI